MDCYLYTLRNETTYHIYYVPLSSLPRHKKAQNSNNSESQPINCLY